ncbi:MAG: ArnT family glycosyltransferase, partial [Marinirhabdus sp.]
MKPQAEHHIPLLVLTCFAIFFVNLNTLDPNIMEARNFTTAREMLHDGNWLLTTLNGAPRYQKPPLPTWLTAVSGAVFGLKNLWALRLPAALAALLLVLFSYKFLVKLTKNKPFAFIGALVLATSFYVVFAGRNGQWDIFTHAFMMAAIYYLFRFFKLGRDGPNFKKTRFVFALWAGLFFGLSFMSKGPVSVYALLLPFLIAFAVVYKPKGFRGKRLPLFVFTVAAIGISSWWYGYTYFYDTAGAAITAQRETANWTNYNVRPFYYYWSFFTQSGVWAIMAFIGLLYPYLKTRVFHKKAYTFTVLWVLASVVLLSVIPEKKSRYLLPVLIPLAFSTAFYIEYLFRGFSTLKATWETWPVYFNFGLVALI